MKKKHIFWINIDGFASSQAKHLMEWSQNGTNIYKVDGPIYRQTGAMFDAYLKGKFSRNLIAAKIEVDSILHQLRMIGGPLKFIGGRYPVYDLGGGERRGS